MISISHIVIMFIAGLLSTMNIWVDKISHIRFSMNDIYMSLLMIGWMVLLTGLYQGVINYIYFGAIFVFVIFYAIRNQLFISPNQYKLSMIPHHSMAILMSKKLIKRYDTPVYLRKLGQNIIRTQENEINIMNNYERNNYEINKL